VPLFAGCTEAELARIENLVVEVDVAAGEAITSESGPTEDSFIIATGEANMVVRDHSIAELRPGDVFGNLGTLCSDHPANATVTAVTPMKVLVVERRHLPELAALPTVARRLISTAVGLLGTDGVRR
jgi:CRP-like cAMP-binding protein